MLKTIFDPEIPVNIYELGLVYEVNVMPENVVEIVMTLTSPSCPVAGTLPGEVEEKVKNKKIIMKREAKKKRFIECYQRMLARMNDVDTRLFLLAEENIEN